MSTQPPDPEIEKLLADLRSDYPNRRQVAAEEIAKRKLQNDEIIKELKVNAFNDTSVYARQAAEHALLSLGVIVSPAPASVSTVSSPAKPRTVLSRNEQIRDFIIGFVGWFLVNFVLWQAVLVLDPEPHWRGNYHPIASLGYTASLLPFLIILIVINLIVLIVLAFRRRWVALGMFVPLVLVIAFAGFILILFFGPRPPVTIIPLR